MPGFDLALLLLVLTQQCLPGSRDTFCAHGVGGISSNVLWLFLPYIQKAQQRELTVQHVKQTEKELGHQLRLQREQYEAAIQRHLAFIDQVILPPISEPCFWSQKLRWLLPCPPADAFSSPCTAH